MTRRSVIAVVFSMLLIAPRMFSQAASTAPAPPPLPTQKVLIHIHSSNSDEITAAVNKAVKIVADAKPGSVLVEVLVTKDALKLVDKTNALSAMVSAAIEKDVSFEVCHMSMRIDQMAVNQLVAGAGVIPSGRLELVVRKDEGWTLLDDSNLKQ